MYNVDYRNTISRLGERINDTQEIITQIKENVTPPNKLNPINDLLMGIWRRLYEVRLKEKRLLNIGKDITDLDKDIRKLMWKEPLRYKLFVDPIYLTLIQLRMANSDGEKSNALIKVLDEQSEKLTQTFLEDTGNHDIKKDALDKMVGGIDAVGYFTFKIVLNHDSQEKLVEIIAKKAQTWNPKLGPKAFFQDWIQSTNLPDEWQQERIDALSGSAEFNARNLIIWAQNQGRNPEEKGFPTLGNLLITLLPYLGQEDNNFLTALIKRYNLYLQKNLLVEYEMRYQIPKDAIQLGREPVDLGPNFVWRGPSDADAEIELHHIESLRSVVRE